MSTHAGAHTHTHAQHTHTHTHTHTHACTHAYTQLSSVQVSCSSVFCVVKLRKLGFIYPLAALAMTTFANLCSILSRTGRSTSDGQKVIFKTGLDEICFTYGGKHKQLNQFLKYLETDGVRQNEWKLDAVPKLLAWLGKHLKDEEWALIKSMNLPRVQSWTTSAKPKSTPTAEPKEPNAPSEPNNDNNNARKARTPKPDGRAARCKVPGRVVGASQRCSNYTAFEKQQLIRALWQRDSTIKTLRKLVYSLKYQVRNNQRDFNSLKSIVDEGEKQAANGLDDKSALEITFSREGGRRLSTEGQLSAAIRRSMTTVACADFGLLLLLDHFDRYKMARSEVVAGLRLQANSRCFYETISSTMACHKEDFASGVHGASNDATVGTMFRHQKLSTCFMDSSYFIAGITDFEELSDLPSQRRCCDMVVVHGGRAEDSMAILLKHLESIGAPTWRTQPASPKHCETFLYVSDRGSDQAKMRTILPHDVRSITVFLFSVDCFDHALQCNEQGALKLIDLKLKGWGKQWLYYSSCVKLGHTWRGYHFQMYKTILTGYGPIIGAAARYLCPICDAGRWGAVHVFEGKVGTVGVPVLLDALGQAVANKKTQKSDCRALFQQQVLMNALLNQ